MCRQDLNRFLSLIWVSFCYLHLSSAFSLKTLKHVPKSSFFETSLKLHKLDKELPPKGNMPPSAQEWDFHLLEKKDLDNAAVLAMDCFFTPRLKLDLDGMGSAEKWVWANIIKTFTDMDKLDTKNGNWLGFFTRSLKRLEEPNLQPSTFSFILAATHKTSDGNELAGIVEVGLEETNDDLAPPMRNPFRSPIVDPAYEPYLCNLCVADKYKRKGLGRLMCEICEEIVQMHWEKNKMYLHVEQRNAAAQALYNGLGYQFVPPQYSALQRKLLGMEGILYYYKPLTRKWIRPWTDSDSLVGHGIHQVVDSHIDSNNADHVVDNHQQPQPVDVDELSLTASAELGMSQVELEVASDIMRTNSV
jgi:ribosomal protein S18 acetylase RimI-like enzyme